MTSGLLYTGIALLVDLALLGIAYGVGRASCKPVLPRAVARRNAPPARRIRSS